MTDSSVPQMHISSGLVHERYAFLSINYTTGAPDSYFALEATNFLPGETLSVSINGQSLGSVQVRADGTSQFLLSTAEADEGSYHVTVRGQGEATAQFLLDSAAPIRAQEGEGPILEVPADIAFIEFLYLPIVGSQ